jgi:drug/metabolite transporter (DMT)-like permease
MKEKQSTVIGESLLVFAALIWGTAFMFQTLGIRQGILPYTFVTMRSAIAALVMGFIIVLRAKVNPNKTLTKLGTKQGYLLAVASGITIALAMVLQQIGLGGTTTAKAGFLTSLYIVFVPVIGSFFHRRITVKTMIAVVIAVFGFYFLSLFGSESGFVFFDGLIVMCAIAYAGQILLIDRVGKQLDSLMFSCVQFATASLVTALPTLLIEGIAWTWIGSVPAWLSMLYVAIISSCLAYTLQVVGQKRARNGTIASLIMSLEAIFAAVSGYLFLQDILTIAQLLGMGLIMLAILIVTIVKPAPVMK